MFGRRCESAAELAAGWKERPVGISPFVGGLVPDGWNPSTTKLSILSIQ